MLGLILAPLLCAGPLVSLPVALVPGALAPGAPWLAGLLQAARAADTDSFYEAYFAELEDEDPVRAAKLYEKSLSNGGLSPDLAAQARERLAGCREEIACENFANLMPAEPWVYVEFDRPGEHLQELVKGLGLLRDPHSLSANRRLALSPEVCEGLLGMRGAALAITGFNPMQGRPSGVLVLHPGQLDLVRGLLQTVLPAAVPLAQPIEGYPTWQIENEVYVTLTRRLVICSPRKSELRAVLRRLAQASNPEAAGTATGELALADNARLMQHLTEGSTQPGLIRFLVNPKPLLPLLDGLQKQTDARKLATLRALLDPEHLEALTGSLAVGEDGLGLDLTLTLADQHHNLVFNLLRTPALDRRTLERVPAEAAGFLALALNPFDPDRRPSAEPLAVSGLDLGRELFGNLASAALFALPSTSPDGSKTAGPPIPDLAAVLTVNDPAKSEALWSLILGMASLAGGGALEGQRLELGDHVARTWEFAQGPRVFVIQDQHELILASSARALERAVSLSPADSVLFDAEYGRALAAIGLTQDAGQATIDVTKLLLARPDRLWTLAREHVSEGERRELDPLAALCSQTVIGASLRHSAKRLKLHAGLTGLPEIGPLIERGFDEFVRSDRGRPSPPSPIELTAAQAEPTLEDLFWKHAGKRDARHVAIASELGQAFLETHTADPKALSSFAERVLNDSSARDQHLEIAHTALVFSNEATGFADWRALELLARAELLQGSPGVAGDLVDQALSAVGTNPAPASLLALRERCQSGVSAR